MAFSGTSRIDEAIKKYGGDDDAYQQKLKKHIRDAMGYSNFVSRQNRLSGKDIDLGDIEGMTPEGIKAMVSGRMDIQGQKIDSADRIMRGMDTAADSLASDKIARSKASAGSGGTKSSFGNNVLFEPKDSLDVDILNTVQNAWNVSQDGEREDIKSLQQIEAEIIDRWKAAQPQEDQRGMLSYDYRATPDQPEAMHSEEEIKNRIRERLPQDYIGNEGKYMLMMRGFSEKEADENAKAMNYYDASEPVKRIYEQTNPQLVKTLEQEPEFPKAVKQAAATDENGDPVWSMDDLVKNNPEVTEKTIKDKLSPVYKDHASKFVDSYLQQENDEGLKMSEMFGDFFVNGNEKDINGFNAIADDWRYKELKRRMKMSYSGVFANDEELDTFLLNQITNNFRQQQQPQQQPQQQGGAGAYLGGFQLNNN